MGLLDSLNSSMDQQNEQGERILEEGQQACEEANSMKSALEGLDVVDDETQAIIESATNGAKEVATEQAESRIGSPMESVTVGIEQIKTDAIDAASTESGNAENISSVEGDYSSVASQASGNFIELARQYEDVNQNAQAIKEAFSSRSEEMKKQLESFF